MEPEDLVFGDREGIVVIPKAVEKIVLAEACRVGSTEKRILVDIALGVPADQLVSEYGFF